MRTLARRYGISDVGLAKTCRKLRIPLPGRGYWARQAAGQKVSRTPLPDWKGAPRLQMPDPKPAPNLEAVADEPDLKRIEELTNAEGELVLKRGSLSHSLIASARTLLREARVDDQKRIVPPGSCLDVRVSKGSLSRALRIMAGLIAALETEGFTVALRPGGREGTAAVVHGQELRFGIFETAHRIDVEREGAASRDVQFRPGGQLQIEVWNPWPVTCQRRWADRKTRKLEQMVPQCVAGFIKIALEKNLHERIEEAEKADARRRANERAQLARRFKEEEEMVRALRWATADWVRAQQIREFILAVRDTSVREGQSVEPDTPMGDWIVWALQQADRLDPLTESPRSILDRRSEFQPLARSWPQAKEPDPPFRFPKPIWRIK